MASMSLKICWQSCWQSCWSCWQSGHSHMLRACAGWKAASCCS